jgi:2-polyprenyl-3-methyl-5-hydroxy-6-metoxy-1,4-benzoquinol methylase
MMKSTPYNLIARIAGLYDFGLWLVGYKQSVDNFVAQVPFERDSSIKILDAGCGTGLYTLALLNKYPNAHITSFDLDGKLVERLRYKLHRNKLHDRARLFTANIQGSLQEIEGERFDLIITAGVLEYTQPEATVKSLARFMVPGGYFLNSPVKHNLFGKVICRLYACKPHTKKININAFTSNGFTLVKSVVPYSFKELHIFRYSTV